MSVKDIQLKGDNICNVECMDKNSILHPESCVNQIKIADNVSITLDDWLTYNPSDTSTPLGGFDNYNGLLPWLTENYPVPEYTPYQLPTATASVKGGIKVGDYLIIDNERLSVDISSISIPDISTFEDSGVVCLGSETEIDSTFEPDTDYVALEENSFAFPLKLDSNKHAGVVLSKDFFSESNNVKWENVLNAPTVSNNTLTIIYNGTEYSFQSNGNSNTELTINSSSYTQGEGISINDQTISQSAATNNNLGGIKTNFTSTENSKAVKLDSNNNAYVTIRDAAGAWVGNGFSQHYFKIDNNNWQASTSWIPIMKIERNDTRDNFKIDIHFQIISRHAFHYFGDYYINYKEDCTSSKVSTGSIITVANVSQTVTVGGISTKILDSSDISIRLFDANDNEVHSCSNGTYKNSNQDTTGVPVTAIVYRKIEDISQSFNGNDVFIVSILGNNGELDNVAINTMTYYCTERYTGNGNEQILNIADCIGSVTLPTFFNYYD